MSSIKFAIQSVQEAATAGIVGNMGAPLRTGEFDEPGADPEDIQFSKNPFTFGLIPEAEDAEQNAVELSEMEAGVAGPSRCLHQA